MTHLRLIHIVLLGSLVWPAAAQQWQEHQPMDQPRTGLATAVLGGQIYLLGGKDQFGNVLDAAVRYDPESGQVFPLPAMLKARVDAAAVVFEGRIFVMGGRGDNGDVLDDVEFYDPNDNRWRSFASLTEKRQGLVAVANDTSIVVAGGSNNQDQFLESIAYYDQSEQRWKTVLTLNPGDGSVVPLELTPRAALAAAGIGGNVLFLGGFSQRGPLDVVEELGPGGALIQRTPLPTARGNLAATAIDDSVYAIGGLDGANRVLADVQRFDLNTNTWQPMPRLRIGREGCAAAALGSMLYVFGGSDAGGRVLDSVESYRRSVLATAGEEEETPAPGGFGLASNYPNPFQTTTTITFTVSETEGDRHVVLTVYDVLGRRVAVLFDGVLEPGRHTVTWDGTDRGGAPVSDGLYVYRLGQGALRAYKMMAVIR